MPHVHEVFGVEPQNRYQVAHDGLAASLDRILEFATESLPADGERWKKAEDIAFESIHQFSDVYGIGTDEDGMQQRLDFTRALNTKLRRGINPLKAQIINDPIAFTQRARETGMLYEPGNEISADIVERFESAAFRAQHAAASLQGYESLADMSDEDNTPPTQGLFDASPEISEPMPPQNLSRWQKIRQAIADRREHSSRGRFRRGAVVLGVTATALAGIAWGASGLDTDSENRLLKDDAGLVDTASGSSSLATTTTQLSEPEYPDVGVSSELTPEPVEQIPTLDVGPMQSVAVPADSSVWRTLREVYGTPNVARQELDNRILEAIPHLIADNPEIEDLNEVNAGQAVVVGPQAFDILNGETA